MAKDKYQSFIDNGGLNRVYLMRMRGAQDKEIFEALQISKQTFYRWLKEHSDLYDAYKTGKEESIAEAIKALTSKFAVQTLTEKVTEVWENGDGSQRKHIVTKSRQVPPDTTALIFYLKAQAGWRDNAEITDTSAIAKLDEILKQTQKAAEDAVLK